MLRPVWFINVCVVEGFNRFIYFAVLSFPHLGSVVDLFVWSDPINEHIVRYTAYGNFVVVSACDDKHNGTLCCIKRLVEVFLFIRFLFFRCFWSFVWRVDSMWTWTHWPVLNVESRTDNVVSEWTEHTQKTATAHNNITITNHSACAIHPVASEPEIRRFVNVCRSSNSICTHKGHITHCLPFFTHLYVRRKENRRATSQNGNVANVSIEQHTHEIHVSIVFR